MKRVLILLCVFSMLLSGCSLLRPVEVPEPVGSESDVESETDNESVEDTYSESTEVPDDPDLDSEEGTEPDSIAEDTDTHESESISESEAEPEPVIPNDEYFNGSVFIGDSIMEGIRNYVERVRMMGDKMLGEAKFVTSVMGISLADLIGEKANPVFYRYKGKEQPLSAILDDIKPKRIFLLLGLNDLAMEDTPVEQVALRYRTLIESLRQTNKNAEVVVLLNTPKIGSAWLPDYVLNKSFDNTRILSFVTELRQLCETMSVPYVDSYSCLAENGVLPDSLCSDGYLHLNEHGASVVIEALYEFASDKK